MSYDIARIAELGSLLARTAIANAESEVSALTEPDFTDSLEDEAAYVRLGHLRDLLALAACSAVIQIGHPLGNFDAALLTVGYAVENGLDYWNNLDRYVASSLV